MRKRLVGCVTTTLHDAAQILRETEQVLPPWLTIGIGVLVGDKTMRGEKLTSRWQRFCSTQDGAKQICSLTDAPRSAFILHTFTSALTPPEVVHHIESAMEWCGREPDYLALDMCWPNQGIFEDLSKRHPRMRFILQLDKEARRAYGGSALACIGAVRNHLYTELLQGDDPCISHILWGGSASAGVPFSSSDAREFVDTMHRLLPQIEPMVAGGLAPDRLNPLFHLASGFPNRHIACSVDAESGLAPDLKSPPCPERTVRYMVQAVGVLQTTAV